MRNYFEEAFIFVKEEIEFLWFDNFLPLIVGICEEDQWSEVIVLCYFLYYRQSLQELRDGDLISSFIRKQLEKPPLGLI